MSVQRVYCGAVDDEERKSDSYRKHVLDADLNNSQNRKHSRTDDHRGVAEQTLEHVIVQKIGISCIVLVEQDPDKSAYASCPKGEFCQRSVSKIIASFDKGGDQQQPHADIAGIYGEKHRRLCYGSSGCQIIHPERAVVEYNGYDGEKFDGNAFAFIRFAKEECQKQNSYGNDPGNDHIAYMSRIKHFSLFSNKNCYRPRRNKAILTRNGYKVNRKIVRKMRAVRRIGDKRFSKRRKKGDFRRVFWKK